MELRILEAEANTYTLQERIKVTWHSYKLTFANCQLFAVLKTGNLSQPQGFPVGNRLALPKRNWRPAVRRSAIWPWQTHWNKAMLNVTLRKLILVNTSFYTTMEEMTSLACNTAYQKNN